jgi:hypothetical protein
MGKLAEGVRRDSNRRCAPGGRRDPPAGSGQAWRSASRRRLYAAAKRHLKAKGITREATPQGFCAQVT